MPVAAGRNARLRRRRDQLDGDAVILGQRAERQEQLGRGEPTAMTTIRKGRLRDMVGTVGTPAPCAIRDHFASTCGKPAGRRASRGDHGHESAVCADLGGTPALDTRVVRTPPPRSHHEVERQEKLVDVAQFTLGGTFFTAVAALTGAVMAVGFVVLTGIDRLRHH